MTTPHTLKRIIAGVLLSGGVAVAGIGLAAGTALAERRSTGAGTCNKQWCPGQPWRNSFLPAGALNWDMSVCHDYHLGHVGSVS